MGSGGALTLWPPSYGAGAFTQGIQKSIRYDAVLAIHNHAIVETDQSVSALSLMVELSSANRAISIG